MIRKFALTAVAIATATITQFAWAAEGNLSEQGKNAIGWTPVQVGLCAPVSYPWGFDWDVYGVDIDLFYAANVRLNGVGLSLGAVHATDEMKGVEIAPFCNWNDKDVAGIRITMGLNYAAAPVSGLDIGLFSLYRTQAKGVGINFVGAVQPEFTGLEVAGVCNFAEQKFTGVEAALGLNFARELKGCQFGGINFAQRMKGCQIGFFNIAEECQSGFQLGLVNIIMDNQVKVLPVLNFYFE